MDASNWTIPKDIHQSKQDYDKKTKKIAQKMKKHEGNFYVWKQGLDIEDFLNGELMSKKQIHKLKTSLEELLVVPAENGKPFCKKQDYELADFKFAEGRRFLVKDIF